MFEKKIIPIANYITNKILNQRTQLPFRDLIQYPLPQCLWGYLNIHLNPHLGGQIEVGGMSFNFSSGLCNQEDVQKFRNALNEMWILTVEELHSLTLSSLETSVQFILDPASAITQLIFDRRKSEFVPACDIKVSLDSLAKVFQRWDENIAHSVAVIKPHLSGMATRTVSKTELTHTLRSAIEKDVVSKPLTTIEGNLRSLDELLKLDPELDQNADKFDYTDPICKLLTNRGLMSWTPAVVVERDVCGGILDIPTAVLAMKRLEIYREYHLIGAEPEDMVQVESEVETLTGFFEAITE